MINLGKKLKIFFTILLEPQQMRPYRLSDLSKNACLKLYNLAHIATNSPSNHMIQMISCSKKLFSPSKLMTIIGDEIPLISEKQSLSKVLLNDENNELSDGTNFWDKKSSINHR